MASIVVKGDPSVQLVAQFPTYNAETKTYTETYEYKGIESAIRGLEIQMQQRGLSYRVSHDGPIWTMQVDIPTQEVDENLDRWEVFTESTEKSLFELPDIIEIAEDFDAGRNSSADLTFRSEIENAAQNGYSDILNAYMELISAEWISAINILVSHFRAGVTGWQLDLLVLRRTRRVEAYVSNGFPLTLDAGLYYYSTAQLNVPGNVGFTLPDYPDAPGSVSIYEWGWRKRSQRVESVGSFVEQTVELVFAPWSTLAYTASNADLIW
jgi:hypothetical protein